MNDLELTFEARVREVFTHNDSLTATLVDNDGNPKEVEFLTYEDAVRDIPNLEGEYEVYF